MNLVRRACLIVTLKLPDVPSGTSACPNASFFCRNEGHYGMVIRSSRVNDGLCGMLCYSAVKVSIFSNVKQNLSAVMDRMRPLGYARTSARRLGRHIGRRLKLKRKHERQYVDR